MVWQLQQVHPNRPDAVAFQTALAALVNAAAESPEAVDAAYFELEDMHTKVGLEFRPIATDACSSILACFLC